MDIYADRTANAHYVERVSESLGQAKELSEP